MAEDHGASRVLRFSATWLLAYMISRLNIPTDILKNYFAEETDVRGQD